MVLTLLLPLNLLFGLFFFSVLFAYHFRKPWHRHYYVMVCYRKNNVGDDQMSSSKFNLTWQKGFLTVTEYTFTSPLTACPDLRTLPLQGLAQLTVRAGTVRVKLPKLTTANLPIPWLRSMKIPASAKEPSPSGLMPFLYFLNSFENWLSSQPAWPRIFPQRSGASVVSTFEIGETEMAPMGRRNHWFLALPYKSKWKAT